MSHYGSIPPPAPYVPPTQGAPAQPQGSPQPSPYQSAASNHGAPNQTHKAGGTFGQMMNQRIEQAVTTGKPMLNKLGKTISSKLGNKPPPGPPQHLQSYQNYQNHQGQQNQHQGYQQQPSQTFSPQPQQQQWGQPQHQPSPLPPNAYASPQQSPYQLSSYATPASGHSGQSNYFPQQTNQAPNAHHYTPQHPSNVTGYNTIQYGQGGDKTGQIQQHGQAMQSQPQAPFPKEHQLQSQLTGQHVGVVGAMQSGPTIQSSHMSNISPEIPPQPTQPQWGYTGSEQLPPAAAQQQPGMPLSSTHLLQPIPSPPVQQEQNQQWNNLPPVSPQGQGQEQMQMPPHSISPPPTQQVNVTPQIPTNKPTQAAQPPTAASQHTAPHSASAEFIAELPANVGSMESKPQVSDPSAPALQYQAYRPSGSQSGSPSPGFTIPRRTLSASTFPLADPWRFADPVTELPTREFYILADLLFDALDRKVEPKNTGLLEAPKMLGSWAKLTEDARHLFSYKSYSAFAKLWSLEGIPHIMVPCQPALTPNWHFNQHSHAQDLKVISESPTPMSTYATYMPALNRPGWYKFLFLEMMHTPEDIGDLIALCADTYKPGVLNHPDLNKRDKTQMPVLQARAAAIQTYAIGRVCEETKTAMMVDSGTQPTAPPVALQPSVDTPSDEIAAAIISL
ncbi:hypothetical protein EJ02DRAFT_456331 [Clathrospora elynae]|uniref:Uncharacterized protein n=1 Tax=Clathrospora elynae TaxID=706981 RepID=A0A6A5SKB3_9PLEO|nr:hypothetical protein EJ02DRAFT_456331 [Clathrospora elynae]